VQYPIVVHPTTAEYISNYLISPSHALLLTGQTGSGKRLIALSLVASLLNIKPAAVLDHPYVSIIGSDDGKAIPIEIIRTLEHFLSRKVPSQQVINRVVFIDQAELLGIEAQNALLKTLEEPPTGTILILTAPSERSILPTIKSRMQSIAIIRPSTELTREYFSNKGYAQPKVAEALAISGGLPGLMAALLSDADHPLVPATRKAREILQASTYQRLLLVDELSKQRPLAIDTLFILEQMAHIRLKTADANSSGQWQAILTHCYSARELLTGNVQSKLVLTNLMFQLSK
jgi:hypothetical protein